MVYNHNAYIGVRLGQCIFRGLMKVTLIRCAILYVYPALALIVYSVRSIREQRVYQTRLQHTDEIWQHPMTVCV